MCLPISEEFVVYTRKEFVVEFKLIQLKPLIGVRQVQVRSIMVGSSVPSLRMNAFTKLVGVV